MNDAGLRGLHRLRQHDLAVRRPGRPNRALLDQRGVEDRVEAEWIAGRIGSRECLERQMAHVRIEPAALAAYLRTIRLDPGFRPLVQFLRDRGIEPVILSDGFTPIIAAILSHHGIRGVAIFANELRHEGDRLTVAFPTPARSAAPRATASAPISSAAAGPPAPRRSTSATAAPTSARPGSARSSSPRTASSNISPSSTEAAFRSGIWTVRSRPNSQTCCHDRSIRPPTPLPIPPKPKTCSASKPNTVPGATPSITPRN